MQPNLHVIKYFKLLHANGHFRPGQPLVAKDPETLWLDATWRRTWRTLHPHTFTN